MTTIPATATQEIAALKHQVAEIDAQIGRLNLELSDTPQIRLGRLEEERRQIQAVIAEKAAAAAAEAYAAEVQRLAAVVDVLSNDLDATLGRIVTKAAPHLVTLLTTATAEGDRLMSDIYAIDASKLRGGDQQRHAGRINELVQVLRQFPTWARDAALQKAVETINAK